MDRVGKRNTIPNKVSAVYDCPDPKTRRSSASNKSSGKCFWDEALFECLQDFSSSNFSTISQTEFTVHPTDVDTTYVLRGDSSSILEAVAPTAVDYRSEEDDYGHREGSYGDHAALHYDEVEDSGPPARPQEFPTPFVHEGVRTTICAMDHRTRKVRKVKNVLLAASAAPVTTTATSTTTAYQYYGKQLAYPTTATTPPLLPVEERAYLLKKKVSRSTYGNVYLSVVLRRRASSSRHTSFETENDEKHPEDEWDYSNGSSSSGNPVEWESTDEFVSVTVSPWNRAMQTHRASLSRKREGVVHMIAAMQHVGNYHPHVLGLLDVFQDEDHLYTVTKFHGGMDLQTKIITGREQGPYVPNEPQARLIFSQLLQGLFHLQRKGVYHSNLSLENIYIDPTNHQNLVIEDLGRCMRVAYNDPSNFGCIIGETEGTTRRLLKLQSQDFQTHPAQNLMYLAPEILENETAFDGFAADLWAAGCILFVLLVGMSPFKTAHYWDAAYAEIASGNLHGLLSSLNIHLSDEATGLLQNMFWRDPRDRLTLAQIMDHPWVKNELFIGGNRNKLGTNSLSSSLERNLSGSHLSTMETNSTCSSMATDKTSGEHQRRRSTSAGSRKSLTKTISGMFCSTTSVAAEKSPSGSVSKSLSRMLLSSSRGSNHSVGGNTRRRASLGGLSSAASSATAGSPASASSLTGEEEKNSSSFHFQVLQIPNL